IYIYFSIWLISLISLVKCLYQCPSGARIYEGVNREQIQAAKNLLDSEVNFMFNQNRYLYKGDLHYNGNVRYKVSV
ncbi:putative secreted effector protein, partial [Blumeria graminis f. sp. tritici 96224]